MQQLAWKVNLTLVSDMPVSGVNGRHSADGRFVGGRSVMWCGDCDGRGMVVQEVWMSFSFVSEEAGAMSEAGSGSCSLLHAKHCCATVFR